MSLQRPDCPRVVAVERCDGEGTPVLDDDRDQRGSPGDGDPTGTWQRRPRAVTKAPRPAGKRGCCQEREPDPAEAHAHEREVRRHDPREHDPAEVSKAGPADELSPGA